MSRKTRKLMWSVPLIAAVAVIGALAAVIAVAPGSLFADDAPGKPNLMQPQAEGPRSIKLTWTAPAGESPMGYRIDVSVGNNPHVWSELEANFSGTEYVHTLEESDVVVTGTQPIKTTRYYRVFALNRHGVGDESDIKRGDTEGVSVPEPVETVTARATGPNSVTVSWEAPEDNGGMSITEYRVVQSTTSGGGTTGVEITSGTKAAATARSMTVSKLAADTQYYFRVYASNKVGRSGVGVPGDVRTNKASRPSQPTGLVALQSDADDFSSAINLYWLEPTDTGGRDITSYIIEYKVNSFQWQQDEIIPGTTPEFPTGDTSPINFAHAISDIDPTDAGDQSPQQGDRVRYKVSAKHVDATSRASREATVTLIDIDIDNDPNTNSDEDDEDDRPPAPERVVASTESDTPGRIELSWSHDLKTGYRIDVSSDGLVWKALEDTTNLKVEPLTGSSRRYIHDGLDAGEQRHYRVFASDGGFIGLATSTQTIGQAGASVNPASPSVFTATVVSATQINLSWTEPSEIGGRDIRRYLLEIDDEPFAVDTTTGIADELTDVPADDVALGDDKTGMIWINGTSYKHTGLEDDTRYYYRLRSDNSTETVSPVLTTVLAGVVTSAGTITPVKDAAQQTAKTHAHAAPAAPHSLSAHQGVKTSSGDFTDQGVYLTWLTAEMDGGPVEEYEIIRSVADEDDLQILVPGSGANARTFYNDDATQASLDNKSRRYRVRAISEAGTSAWTPWVTYPYPPADHVHNEAPMAEGMIDDVTVTEGGMRTMDVSMYFSDAENDALTYTASSDMGMYATADIPAGTSMLTITGVAAGTATIRVMATDMDGSGMSATQTFDVMVTMKLQAPSNVRVDPQGSGLVQVEWDTAAGAHGYTIVAINLDDSPNEVKVIDDPDAVVTQIVLPVDERYNIYVWSWAPGGQFETDFSETKRGVVVE